MSANVGALSKQKQLLSALGGVERLADLKGGPAERPMVRKDAIVRRLVQIGEVTFAVKNPETNKVYTFDEATWELITHYDGTRTRQEILRDYNSMFPEGAGIPLQHVLDLEESLRTEKLLYQSNTERSLALLKASRKRASDNKSEGVNPLYMLYHVWDPNRFLDRTVKYVRVLWSPPVVAVFGVFFAMTLWVFIQHFGPIWQETLETYAFLRKPFWDVVQFFTILTSIGYFHELSHAYVTKMYGGEVHSIGLAFMYFAPAFYCDTSDSILFESKWQRLWVTFAGIYIEAIMCAGATFLWVVSYPDTLVHELAYKTMLFTGISTIFFNINPLIKIDGYWALTDMLGMPSLREDSIAYLGAWIQKKIFRLNVPLEPLSKKRRRIYIFYAILACWYASLVMLFIGKLFMNFYSKYFPNVALLLVTITMLKIFKKRVNLALRVLKLFYLDKKELLMSKRMRPRLAAAAAVVLVAVAVPWTRRSVSSPIVLEPLSVARLEAPETAGVASVAVHEGQTVARGQVLLTLASAGLSAHMAEVAAEKERLESELAHARSRNEADASYRAERRLEALNAELDSGDARRARLVLRSPMAGRVLTARPADLEGRVVTSGTPLLTIGDCSKMTAEIPVTERLLTDLARGERVTARLHGRPLEKRTGELVSVAPATESTAEDAEKKHGALRPPERPDRFVALAEFDNSDAALLPRMSGVARIYGARTSYLGRSARVLRRWFQTVVW
jgi:putative peptide zinc metalloprotease protein